MNLTPAQKTTLKTHLAANTNTTPAVDSAGQPLVTPFVINTQHTSGDAEKERAIAEWYTLAAPGPYLVWKPSVSWAEIMKNGMDWTRVDNLSVGKARIWDWMFGGPTGTIDPSKANMRTGIDAVWVGTAADLAVRASVYGHCRRGVNNLERVLVTATPNGVGTRGTETNPDTLGVGNDGEPVEGSVTQSELHDIIING